jgi:lysophospholipase L1-like esterase/heme/copper-type cytochrome/quinol oxidase subunit 4
VSGKKASRKRAAKAERSDAPGAPPPPNPRMARVVKISRLVGYCLAVVFSLLSFPSVLPTTVALWLVASTISTIRGQVVQARVCLVTSLAVLALHNPPWFSGVIVFALIAALIAVATIGAKAPSRTVSVLLLVMVWGAWGEFAYDWTLSAQATSRVRLDPHRPVACIGDSLMAGENDGGGFVPLLAKMVPCPVLDFSRAGITSVEAQQDLPKILEAKPQVLVVELGGHDYLKGRSRAETKQSLEDFILAAHSIGARVVLMEVPRSFVFDPFRGLERELARQYDLELVPDSAIRECVLWSPMAPPGMWTGGPWLSDDGLHPNPRGNELLAKQVAKALGAR